MSKRTDACPLCGGSKSNGTTTFAADIGTGVVVVRNVAAQVCSQCGEEWISDADAERLEKMVEQARHRGLEVEVARF